MNSLLGQTVLLDSKNSYVYVGVLESADGDFYVLTEADVHDLRDTPTLSREQYVQRCREHGVAVNRARVWIAKVEVAGFSRLEDVVSG